MYLAASFGFYCDTHPAGKDCYTGLAILLQTNDDGIGCFQQSIENSLISSVALRAQHAPFDKKDVLKERDYFWKDGTEAFAKGWEIVVSETEAADERTETT